MQLGDEPHIIIVCELIQDQITALACRASFCRTNPYPIDTAGHVVFVSTPRPAIRNNPLSVASPDISFQIQPLRSKAYGQAPRGPGSTGWLSGTAQTERLHIRLER
jgi:hypothetical protein